MRAQRDSIEDLRPHPYRNVDFKRPYRERERERERESLVYEGIITDISDTSTENQLVSPTQNGIKPV